MASTTRDLLRWAAKNKSEVTLSASQARWLLRKLRDVDQLQALAWICGWKRAGVARKEQE